MDNYVIRIFRSGTKYVWEMQAPNGVMICRSIKIFNSAGRARESIENWMDIIRNRSVYILEESVPNANMMGPPPKPNASD